MKIYRMAKTMEKKTAENVFERTTDEVLEDVLMHLANPKLITQCKLVCRRWYTIVSRLSRRNKTNRSKSFTLLVQWRVKAPERDKEQYKYPVLAFSSDTGLVSNFDIVLNPMMDLYESVVASCNDLILVAYNRTYHVNNPEIHQWITLPPPPCPLVDDDQFGAGYNVGFLWDYDSDLNLTYKVNRIGRSSVGALKNGSILGTANAQISMQIYDSHTNVWSEYAVDWYTRDLTLYLTDTPILSHAGMFHWLKGTSLLSLDPSDLQLNDDGVPRLHRTVELPKMDLFSPRMPVSNNAASGTIIIRLFGFGVTESHIRMITEKITVGTSMYRPISLWQLDETRIIGEADAGGMWCLTHTFPFVIIPLELSMIFVKFVAFHPYEWDIVFVQINKAIYQINLRIYERKAFTQVGEPYDGFCWLDKALPPLLHWWFPTQLTPSLAWEV